jgi:hypothetical protein
MEETIGAMTMNTMLPLHHPNQRVFDSKGKECRALRSQNLQHSTIQRNMASFRRCQVQVIPVDGATLSMQTMRSATFQAVP